jgi:4-hydroxythreonine-4-phosphate dehydrogenase
MPKIAISIGDINGVGVQIALESHKEISKLCQPIYCVSKTMMLKAAKLLEHEELELICYETGESFEIAPGVVDEQSGKLSNESFSSAIALAKQKEVDAIVTLPIHKKAWELAGVNYVGHTDMLRDYFKQEAIMMLGCEKLFVALFTEHIPLKEVASNIELPKLKRFLHSLYQSTQHNHIGVLGLNPHAGDDGVLGDEETIITQAIDEVNAELSEAVFFGPLVPDVAFTPKSRATCSMFVAMYHDQGLAPLKALYFDEGINVSLSLPIIRTSVDHGTAFDIAYSGSKVNNLSYINAIKAAIGYSKKQ